MGNILSGLHLSYSHLYWRRPPPDQPPLPPPPGTERTWIATPDGPLEMLVSRPSSGSSSSSSPPSPRKSESEPAGARRRRRGKPTAILFVHGGMGSAWVWGEYMRYLSSSSSSSSDGYEEEDNNNITCYALSLRGHGASWHPGFLRMAYGTTRGMLGRDVADAWRWVVEDQRRERLRAREGTGGGKGEDGDEDGDDDGDSVNVVIVGHSSGGGLVQGLLDTGAIKGVRGLALLGAVPGTGSFQVYRNWSRLDPWFMLRMVLHGWHPNSPLSHPALVRRAFFGQGLEHGVVSEAQLRAFTARSSRYESFLWPFSMMTPFVDTARVWRSISIMTGGGGSGGGGAVAGGAGNNNDRILIMSGTEDALMTPDVQRRSADTYRAAYSELLVRRSDYQRGGGDPAAAQDPEVHPIAAAVVHHHRGGVGGETIARSMNDDDDDDSGHGVRLAWVPGAGHHLQNDVGWEFGASKLLDFVRQL